MTEGGGGIAVDGAGQGLCHRAFTTSTDFPTTLNSFQPALGGSGDAFVAQLTADGTALKLCHLPRREG